MSKLTPKQKAFADLYIQLGNASEAYKQAGYKNYSSANVEANKTLNNPKIKAYIDEQMKEINSNRIMDAQEALELLTSIARGEMEETVVTASGKAITRRADINQRQKALESLLKRYPSNRQEQLKEQLLEAQIKKIEAETNEFNVDSTDKTIIVNDLDEMRSVLDERSQNNRSD